MTGTPRVGPGLRIAGAGVHLLTASGAVWGLLAIHAISEARLKAALVWMAVAVLVDAIDGPLARTVRIRRTWPGIDGALLDNIVDYLNYVIVPAYLIVGQRLLPSEFLWPGAAAICLASAFQFTQTDAKTEDHFFTGFPSYWNLMAFYFVVLESPRAINLGVVAILTALVFVPVRYIYPTRTRTLRGLTLTVTAGWAACLLFLLMAYPRLHPEIGYGSLTYIPYYVGMSLWLTRAPPSRTSPSRDSD